MTTAKTHSPLETAPVTAAGRSATNENKKKLFIAIPCYDSVPCSVVEALLKADKELPFPHTIHFLGGCSNITLARNHLAAEFMCNEQFTHLLFIDCDIVFTPGDITDLLARDLPIVGGSYRKKQAQPIWCSDGFGYAPAVPQAGLIEVRHVGAGFLSIKREVLERMIEAYDHIEYNAYNDSDQDGLLVSGRTEWNFFPSGVCQSRDSALPRCYSEDWYFCELARGLGYKIYVDGNVILKHIGKALLAVDESDGHEKR